MLSDEEKEELIQTLMKERGIEGLLLFTCPNCGTAVGYLGKDSSFGYGECLICGLRVLIPREGDPITGDNRQ